MFSSTTKFIKMNVILGESVNQKILHCRMR